MKQERAVHQHRNDTMEKADRKQLLQQYKERKPDMGILAFTCTATGDVFLRPSTDLVADVNGTLFRLGMGGNDMGADIRALWQQYGKEGFAVTTLDTLAHEENSDKTGKDYLPDLHVMLEHYLQTVPNAKPLQPFCKKIK